MIPELEITSVAGKDVAGAWAELTDKCDGFRLKTMTACEFGPAEEVVALLEHEAMTGTATKYEVGVGESLRPYEQVYLGDDRQYAIDVFWQTVVKHASM